MEQFDLDKLPILKCFNGLKRRDKIYSKKYGLGEVHCLYGKDEIIVIFSFGRKRFSANEEEISIVPAKNLLGKKNTVKVTYDGRKMSFAKYKKMMREEKELQKRKKELEANGVKFIDPTLRKSEPLSPKGPVKQMYNILLLDDEPVTLCFHEKLILRFSGKAVFYTATGNSDAERFLQWASPKIDIMISDINHRDGDGLAFIQKIHKAYPELKIFIISGVRDTQQVIARKFLADGIIKGYLPKLFEIPDFIAMLHNAGVE